MATTKDFVQTHAYPVGTRLAQAEAAAKADAEQRTQRHGWRALVWLVGALLAMLAVLGLGSHIDSADDADKAFEHGRMLGRLQALQAVESYRAYGTVGALLTEPSAACEMARMERRPLRQAAWQKLCSGVQ